MAQVGRNQPCPCGSSKKYKRCCLARDEARASETRRALTTTTAAAWDEDDDLDTASNAVVDLIHAGRLDEAEAAARDLLVRYPEVPDGFERLGMVFEARGDRRCAADYYRQAVAFILEHPEGFDGEIPTSLVEQANELDPLPA
jgi:tetratricopeptide (TPR) repeat protein